MSPTNWKWYVTCYVNLLIQEDIVHSNEAGKWLQIVYITNKIEKEGSSKY